MAYSWMMNSAKPYSEQQMLAAFAARDAAWDGRFVVGVTSTKIYCRPSCPARRPKPENVVLLADCGEAEAAGFRPCLRCRPDEVKRDHRAVEQVVTMMDTAEELPKLAELAAATGYSPAHLQRIFKRATGLSPAAYGRALRDERLRAALADGDSVTSAIYEAGFAAASTAYGGSAGRLGMTPSAWKNGGAGAVIRWAVLNSPFGPMLLAATDKGVCRLSFGEGEDDLARHFPKAQLEQGGAGFAALASEVMAAVEQPERGHSIPLDVAGTAFQRRVWQALQEIPPGETRTYTQIAAAAGNPKAVRAAGSANGANPVAVLVPCHRVVRSDGSIGGYAYGETIKRGLLQREAGEKQPRLQFQTKL